MRSIGIRDPDNPILPVVMGTWRHSRVANFSLVIRGDTAYLYYRAGVGVWWAGQVGHEAIGLARRPVAGFNGKGWVDYPFNPIFTQGAPADFDGLGPIDPLVVEHDGTFYLFYEGVANPPEESVPADGVFLKALQWTNRPGLATSRDGINFHRVRTTPLVDDDTFLLSLMCIAWRGGRWEALGLCELAPGVAYDQRRYGYFHYTSDDAMHWRRSRDLLNWRKYPEPVFTLGEPGRWDDGGIWVGDIAHIGDTYYLWYEGRSAGRSRSEEYAPGGYSQIGLATLSAKDFTEITTAFSAP